MELDEFKIIVKDTAPEIPELYAARQLEGYMRKRANAITDKVKRSIIFELVTCIVFIGLAVWAWYSYPVPAVRAFSLLSAGLCIFLILYLGALYKKIVFYEKTLLPVKDSLAQIITILTQFTRSYFQFVMITLPLFFIFGLITGYFMVGGNGGLQHFNWRRALLFYTTWFVIWSAVMYFFSRWFIKKLYGVYLQQLKEQLKDIENG